MKHSMVQLIDLPDELLVMIFLNLNNVELLYSLMSINRRLNRTIFDSVFTKDLTLSGGAKGSGQGEGIPKNGRNSKEFFVNLKLAYKIFLLTDFSQN
jgi:hypothetical protein